MESRTSMSHPKTGKRKRPCQDHSTTDAVVQRVVERRQKEIGRLEPQQSRALQRKLEELIPQSLCNEESTSKKISLLLTKEFARIRDPNESVKLRRESWELVHNLFRFLDNLRENNHGDENRTEAASRETERLQKPTEATKQSTGRLQQEPSNGKHPPKRTVASLSSASALTMATALGSNEKSHHRPKPLEATLKPPPKKPPPPYEKRSATVIQIRPNSKRAAEPLHRKNSASKPRLQDRAAIQRPQKTSRPSPDTRAMGKASESSPTLASDNAAIVSSSSSASSANIPPAAQKNPDPPWTNPTHPPAIQGTPIPESHAICIALPPDDSDHKQPTRYSGFVHNRPAVRLHFTPQIPTESMKQQFLRRLNRWDPYWKIEETLCIGITSPVTKMNWHGQRKPSEFYPNTAASFRIDKLLRRVGPKICTIPSGQEPKDGELRVLIRMLPFDLSKQPYAGKKRADVHLWPKGTYLQIHAAPKANTRPQPILLTQRKQQSHDLKKWLGVCAHYDATTLLHKSYSDTRSTLDSSPFSIVELGCYDSELYMFHVALCRYRSPRTVSTRLVGPIIKQLTYDEMLARLKKKMDAMEVHVLDDDCDDGSIKQDGNGKQPPRELRRINFSIRDPITMDVLKTPVRGRNCLHNPCFDLDSFLEVNKKPSGQRWKCGICEQFVSIEDLERCPITERAVEQYGNKMTNLQHEVEFREDETMALCKPVRSHQDRAMAKKRAASEPTAQQVPAVANVVTLIDLLDSDEE